MSLQWVDEPGQARYVDRSRTLELSLSHGYDIIGER
jgi:hypothetical protein